LRPSIVILCAALAGCSAVSQPAARCPLPREEPYVRIEMFFGANIPGRGPISDSEWADFVAHAVTDQFPDGFTVVEGAGQWYDQTSGKLVREASKVLIVAADPESDLQTRIGSVVAAYKARFQQQSVGIITSEACGAF
jgi:hypothetical protein